MKEPFSLKKVQNFVVSRLLKHDFVANIHRPDLPKKGQVLLYHKSDAFIPGFRHTYIHTNNWEISCVVKILNRFGYWVDVIDRSIADSFLPENRYDFFIGIGVDDSGRHYAKYAKALTRATRILYATNANPEIGDANIYRRQLEFKRRHHVTLPASRATKLVNVEEVMKYTDFIFSVGNDYANHSFRSYGKPIYKLNVSTAPYLTFDAASLNAKQPSHWLFFAGDGNFKKGLDLVLDTFLLLPHLQLYVCTEIEPEFLAYYAPLLSHASNIHLEPTMLLSDRRFFDLTGHCGFTILPSATEGTPTALASCLRRGVIPVVTYEAGMDIDDFGYLLPGTNIAQIAAAINHLSALPRQEFRQRILRSYLASQQYTQAMYESTFTQSFLSVLAATNRL